MIIHAEYNMIPALKTLWKEGFEDDDHYIDFFFSKRFKPENTFVYLENDSPASIATVLNAEIFHNGVFLPAGYIYGVTTSAKHRGKGLSTAILEHICKIYPVTFLVPATEELFCFYGKRGFSPAFTLGEFNMSAGDLKEPEKKLKTEAVSPEEYKEIRDSHFKSDGYICWNTEAIVYALAENSFLGGKTIKIQIDEKKGKNGILLYRKHCDRLLVIETTLPLPVLRDAVYALMKQEGVCECSVRIASDKTAKDRTFGLLRGVGGLSNAYCNLVLD